MHGETLKFDNISFSYGTQEVPLYNETHVKQPKKAYIINRDQSLIIKHGKKGITIKNTKLVDQFL